MLDEKKHYTYLEILEADIIKQRLKNTSEKLENFSKPSFAEEISSKV